MNINRENIFSNCKVVLIEKHQYDYILIREIFESTNAEIVWFSSFSEFKKYNQNSKTDILLITPEYIDTVNDGFIKELKKGKTEIPILFLTNYPYKHVKINYSTFDLLPKTSMVEKLLEKTRLLIYNEKN